LLYIKAVYPISSGAIREVRASDYANGMVLDGFSTTDEQSVQLYAVNRSEVESEPVDITVKPLENPIWSVYRSLQILPDFAGVRITAENVQEADIVLEIIRKDSLGKWGPFLPYVYSSQETIGQTNRGLDTLEQEFGVTVRDRFLNYTDTLYQAIRPLYEEQVPKPFSEVRLPGDAEIQTVTGGIPTIWDGNNSSSSSNRMLTEPADPEPQFITIDLG